MAHSTDTVDEVIPFGDFVDLLEKVSNASNAAEKLRRLEAYVKYFRLKFVELHESLESNNQSNAINDSVFSIIRLLYPTGDRKRASYNFKSVALSKMLAKILGLDKGSAEGRKLLEYKDPIKSGLGASDLGMVVYGIMEKRFSHQGSTGDGPTVSQLHQVLDQLARGRTNKEAISQDTQVKILRGFMRKLTPLEGKWLVRILLKDLMLGVNKQQIFKLIHPDAAELLNTLDLEGVCKKLNDPSTLLTDTKAAGISLFSFFKPMLCTRLDKIEDSPRNNEDGADESDDEEAPVPKVKKAKQKKASEPVKLPDPPFILETKWDGERFQVHYERASGPSLAAGEIHKFKYFSRNGFDYTASFAETLSPRLVKQFVDEPPVTSFILDGEMMSWNKESRSFTQKGGNIDVKTLTPDSRHCPLFVVFDILHYNGQSLFNKPLSERIEYLGQVLNQEVSTCQFSEQTMVEDKASVTDELNDAIDRLEEGLVVKAIDSVYQPGKRATDWLKIKPEYIEGHAVEDLDLLILGAYYSDSTQRTRGEITNFLVGLVADNKKEFFPLTTVGFGRLNHRERQELVRNLTEVLVNHEIASIKHGRRRKPDLHIDPKRSVVLQVKASEIIPSKEYELGFSLRFPRITKTRYDKNWDDAMSVKEFTDLRKACDGKLAKKSGGRGRPPWFSKREKPTGKQRGNDSSDEGANEPASAITSKSPVKKKGLVKSPVKSALSVLAAASSSTVKSTSASGVSVLGGGTARKSTIFAGRVFCLIGADKWKEEISSLLIAHGVNTKDAIIPNPMPDCLCIIAEKESLRIKNYKKNGSFDIAKGRMWIDKCIEARRLLDFELEDLFFAKNSTKDTFSTDYDEFGDSYTKPCSLQEVKTLIQNVMEQQKDEVALTPKELNALKRELNEELVTWSPMRGSDSKTKLSKWSYLSGCKIVFRGQLPPLALFSTVTEIEFYGGQVAEKESEAGVTHIIIADADTEFSDNGDGNEKSSARGTSKRPSPSAFVVSTEWLIESLAKKEMQSESRYAITA